MITLKELYEMQLIKEGEKVDEPKKPIKKRA